MTKERYTAVSEYENAPLTPEEITEGWHFCHEWDNLLVGPEMGELEPYSCLSEDHPVYMTIPKRPVHEILALYGPKEDPDGL